MWRPAFVGFLIWRKTILLSVYLVVACELRQSCLSFPKYYSYQRVWSNSGMLGVRQFSLFWSCIQNYGKVRVNCSCWFRIIFVWNKWVCICAVIQPCMYLVFMQILGQQINDFTLPDVNLIGEHADAAELGRMLQLILGCAVNCEQKQGNRFWKHVFLVIVQLLRRKIVLLGFQSETVWFLLMMT